MKQVDLAEIQERQRLLVAAIDARLEKAEQERDAWREATIRIATQFGIALRDPGFDAEAAARSTYEGVMRQTPPTS